MDLYGLGDGNLSNLVPGQVDRCTKWLFKTCIAGGQYDMLTMNRKQGT